MHVPYEKRLGHPEDFKVSYRFYTKEEGGRTMLPFQGIRSDFEFQQPYIRLGDHPSSIFIIWPEFEDANGIVILDNSISVTPSGIARMWIINPELRTIHINQIKVGLRGFFWEGKRTADCIVTEITGLYTNPKHSK